MSDDDELRRQYVVRLAAALDRWEAIGARLVDLRDKTDEAAQPGLGNTIDATALSSTIIKAQQCVAACGDAITSLMADRSSPHIFAASIAAAENGASEHEKVLDQIDADAGDGRLGFREHFGQRASDA